MPTRKAIDDDFDIAGIDEIIHGRVRLGVIAYLTAVDIADFNTLKAKLQTTDGTLSVHLRKLEEAGYVLIDKGYNGRKPITRVRMSPKGRKAFQAYLDAIGRLAGLSDN
jgi:DNA-binding MarR family transcriptional regulator